MKLLFLSSLICVCQLFSNAQLPPADETSVQQIHGQFPGSGLLRKGIPDGVWITWHQNGQVQFIRTYSFDKWKQFQNEKSRYHPKRVSMHITKLFHEDKKQAEKYITAINTFCAKEDCPITNNNNSIEPEHYHPPFEKGLLHGTFANYFPNGSLKDSGHYKDGLPEGVWIKWTDDKQFYWKGYYKHGVKNNEWKLYAANEKLISVVSFRSGKYLWRKDMKDNVEIEQEELSGF